MAEIRVFYIWQADRPASCNRDLIRNAAEDACRRITEDNSNKFSITLDEATAGQPGMCDIPNAILEKIEKADIILADLTFVGKTDGGSAPPKLLTNPNVLVELGYAASAKGFERIVAVMNDTYGSPDNQMFDIKRRHAITFTHPEPQGTEQWDGRVIRTDLSSDIEEAIRTILHVVVSPPNIIGAERGQCTACGHVNEDAKDDAHCANCGRKLWEPCVTCNHSNGVWNICCAQCGANLRSGLKEEIHRIEQLKTTMQDRLKRWEHQAVLAELGAISRHQHTELSTLAVWAKENISVVQDELMQAETRKAMQCEQAKQLLRDKNYEQAVIVLDVVPCQLRDYETTALLEKARDAHTYELRIAEIQEQLDKRNYEGLGKNLRFLEQRYPDDGHAKSLIAQGRTELIGEAMQCSDKANHQAVITLLGELPKEALGQHLRHKLEKAISASKESEMLAGRLYEAGQGGQIAWGELEHLLQLDPANAVGQQLSDQWGASTLEKARSLRRKHSINRVIELLEAVPQTLRGSEMSALLKDCLAKKRQVQKLYRDACKATHAGDVPTARQLLQRLLDIKPNSTEAKRLFQDLRGTDELNSD